MPKNIQHMIDSEELDLLASEPYSVEELERWVEADEEYGFETE